VCVTADFIILRHRLYVFSTYSAVPALVLLSKFAKVIFQITVGTVVITKGRQVCTSDVLYSVF
jgi:hypothetical protein